MPDLPMPVSLNCLPLLTLRESATNDGKEAEHIPVQDIFRPSLANPRYLNGTLNGGIEPFPLALRGVNRVGRCNVGIIHAPYDDATLAIDAPNPPTWLSCTSFVDDRARHTLCFIPCRGTPLLTLTDVYMLPSDAGRAGNSNTGDIDVYLDLGYHVLIVDYTRKRGPGFSSFPNAGGFFAYMASLNEEHRFLNMFRHAA